MGYMIRNGDQNWVSVSRTMKQLGEGGRPSDWYKHLILHVVDCFGVLF